MNIGIYVATGEISGPSKYLIKLTKGLKSLKDIELSLITHDAKNLENYSYDSKIEIRRGGLGIELNEFDLDIVHFNSIRQVLMFPFLKHKKISTVHGDVKWTEPELYDYGNKFTLISKKIEEVIGKNLVDAYIVGSKSIKKSLVKYLKINENDISVTPWGVDHNLFYPQENPEKLLENKHGIKNDFILNVSNYSKRKNPKTLIETFLNLKKKYPNLKLVILGNGWEQFKNHKDIIIPGFVPAKDLSYFYSGAKVFLFPSFHEGFGFPNLEAMACGTVVVTSNRYAMPEVVGDSGFKINPNNKKSFLRIIEELIDNDEKREKYERRALERSKKFSWDKTAKKTLDVYRKILNR